MGLKVREKVGRLFLEGRLPAEDVQKIKAPKGFETQRRAVLLRLLFEMLPGRTFKEKQVQYQRLYHEARILDTSAYERLPRAARVKLGGRDLQHFFGFTGETLRDFLGARGGSWSGRSGKRWRTTTVIAEQLAGIQRLRPSLRDELKNLAQGRLRRPKKRVQSATQGPYETRSLNQRASICLTGLEAAGIIEIERKGNKVIGFETLDPKRFDETLRTGYIQWPKLKPIILR